MIIFKKFDEEPLLFRVVHLGSRRLDFLELG